MNAQDAFKVAFHLTAWFETDGEIYTAAAGNFDKQGLSWGPRQTCIGQGSLQPLMRRMLESDAMPAISLALGPLLPTFQAMCAPGPTTAQLAVAVGACSDDGGRLLPAWASALAKMGAIPQVQQIFMDDASGSIAATTELAAWMAGPGPVTLRCWCLAYDFVTQNGGFNPEFRAAISGFLSALAPFKRDARDRMRAMCWLRAGWTYERGQRSFADNVLDRKLAIVEGSGHVNGRTMDMDGTFGLTDEAVA